MTPKEYLIQYRKALERIRDIDRRIEQFYSIADVKAQRLKPDVVKSSGGTQDVTSDVAAMIADATAQLDKRRTEAFALLNEIADVIDSVPDATHSRLLFDRYIVRMTWEDTALDIGYDAAHTRGRLHGSALESVRKILDERGINER